MKNTIANEEVKQNNLQLMKMSSFEEAVSSEFTEITKFKQSTRNTPSHNLGV